MFLNRNVFTDVTNNETVIYTEMMQRVSQTNRESNTMTVLVHDILSVLELSQMKITKIDKDHTSFSYYVRIVLVRFNIHFV